MKHFILALTLFTGSALPVFATEISGFVDVGGVFTAISDPLGPQGLGITPQGINNAGQVVGDADAGAFLYAGGTLTIDPLGAAVTDFEGINNAGDIVGSETLGVGAYGGFLDVGGTVTTITDPLAPSNTVAVGVNDAGQIVGYYNDAEGSHGFLDVGGTFTTFEDPLATGGTPGNTAGTFPRGINNAGQIVGYYYRPGDARSANALHGFLDVAGTFTTIEDPLGSETIPEGIDDAGQIVGFYANSTGTHGFLDTAGTFVTIDDPLVPGATWATGISGSGEITGFIAIQAPEPSTLAMALAALLAMAGCLRRKRLTPAPWNR